MCPIEYVTELVVNLSDCPTFITSLVLNIILAIALCTPSIWQGRLTQIFSNGSAQVSILGSYRALPVFLVRIYGEYTSRCGFSANTVYVQWW